MNQSNWDNIFNRDFYPTPDNVIEAMQIDCRGLKVLEPSAGKGNILDYLNDNGAKEVFYCEINRDLAKICQAKAKQIGDDFLQLKAEQISHIDMIVMNPPFSKWKEHILHAYNIAPDGCTIISLCNSDSIDILKRGELNHIIRNHSNTYSLGDCFANAERKTNVDITCIHIFKPNYDNETTFEGFYMGTDEYENSAEGIIRYDEIQSYVNSYIGALKQFEKVEQAFAELKPITSKFNLDSGLSYEFSYGTKATNKIEFGKELQRIAWKKIFSYMKMNNIMTRGVMNDINKFIENQTNVPFTRRNIFRMIEIIYGTRQQSLDRALVEVVDNFTRHTHENRFGVEGWKTNAGHLLNKKFIVDYMFEVKHSYHRNGGNLGLRYNSNNERIDDLVKVLCNLTGTLYEQCSSLYGFVDKFNGLESGRWYEWGFFRIKGFKKGTIHLEFTDLNHWWLLNKKYGEIKGFTLPEKFTK